MLSLTTFSHHNRCFNSPGETLWSAVRSCKGNRTFVKTLCLLFMHHSTIVILNRLSLNLVQALVFCSFMTLWAVLTM